MKKEDLQKTSDKAMNVLQKQSDSFLSKLGLAKEKLGEFAPSVMIAIGVSLLIAVFYHPNTIILGAVVGLIFASPVIKKKFFSEKKSTEKKTPKAKKVTAEVVEDKKENQTEDK